MEYTNKYSRLREQGGSPLEEHLQELEVIMAVRTLFRSVILQAVIDATRQINVRTDSERGIQRAHMARAIAWFNLANPDFKQVCDYAGLHPCYVVQKAQQAIKGSIEAARKRNVNRRRCYRVTDTIRYTDRARQGWQTRKEAKKTLAELAGDQEKMLANIVALPIVR